MSKSYIELCVDTTNTNSASTTNPVVRIELPMPVLNINDVFERLVKPALLASGFGEYNVDTLVTQDD